MSKIYRPSVFIVTYKEVGDKIKYLLLHRILHWGGWEFPKGGIDKNENKKEAVRRELKEETGLKAMEVKEFEDRGKFDYHKEFKDRPGIKGQTWQLYAAKVKGEVTLKKNKVREHDDYEWLGFDQAYEKLRWDDQKECLKKVDKWLEKHLD